ncbi:MAG TPA: hypothetical protein VHN74_04705 [Candidatus Angelobacter sp.]|jgi:hypothetical protein|nr:hypothetical protein [Candidatus Angelobacter sp.]
METRSIRKEQYSVPASLIGAVLISIFLAFVPILLSNAQDTEPEDPAKSIKVTGTVTSVQLNEDEKVMKAAVSLNVSAENAGKENLIILRRAPDSIFQSLSTATSPDQPIWSAEHHSPIERGGRDRKWEKLQADLEKSEPDDENTIILGPGDSMGWNIVLQLNIAKVNETSVNAPGGPPTRATWETLKKSCPCKLRFDVEFWPMNLEPKPNAEEPAVGKKLAKRWRKKGLLVLGTRRSEPIDIQFPAK